MIDDFSLMIEKRPLQSAIIGHRSKMLPASILTRQEMLAKGQTGACLRPPARTVRAGATHRHAQGVGYA